MLLYSFSCFWGGFVLFWSTLISFTLAISLYTGVGVCIDPGPDRTGSTWTEDQKVDIPWTGPGNDRTGPDRSRTGLVSSHSQGMPEIWHGVAVPSSTAVLQTNFGTSRPC